ncbi:MAG: type II toxin-antitoxin system PemK/MazF family toxin [Bacteroidota bacterium]|nr:type II toxin-antitoxin system PemK/MazF family toxin [Bacteroidota bacterium]
MKFGDILLIPFPFSELTSVKARPAMVIAETKDKYKDIIVAAISSVIPESTTSNEIIISPSQSNKLKVKSVLKIDRIVTLKKELIIANLGNLDSSSIQKAKETFHSLVN